MNAAEKKSKFAAFFQQQYMWGVLAIVALLIINLIRDPSYLSISISAHGNLVGNVIDILRASAPILMIAVGMTLVIATAGIDLSVGSVMVVAGAVSMEFLKASDTPNAVPTALAALALALAIGTVLGFVNGILVAYIKLQPFITTLIMMMAGRGIAKVITGGQNTATASVPFRWIANGYVFGVPVVFLFALAIVIIVSLIVRRSALGLMVESIGINPKASRMAGIKPRGLLVTVYTVSALLAAVAGVFATASVMAVDISRTGYQLELDAILAVVIGGTSLAGGRFSIGGSVVGALLIATLDKTVVFLGVSSSATPAFKAIVIILLCLLQSDRIRDRFNRYRRRRALRTRKEALA